MITIFLVLFFFTINTFDPPIPSIGLSTIGELLFLKKYLILSIFFIFKGLDSNKLFLSNNFENSIFKPQKHNLFTIYDYLSFISKLTLKI